MNAPSGPLALPAAGRLALVLFGLALLANAALSLVGLDASLMGFQPFRQSQTAITAQHMVTNGISLLGAETPIFGPPWQAPMELPYYQAAVAGLSRCTGWAVDPAGRLVSWLFFLAALPGGYLLLARFSLTPAQRLLCCALAVTSPLFIAYSRAVLIESSAVAFGLWFLACFDRALRGRAFGWWLGAASFGALAGTAKVTTFVVFSFAAALLMGAEARRLGRAAWFSAVARAAALMVVPGLATLAWLRTSAALRHLNPETAFLDADFGFWFFGSLSQRLSLDYWYTTYQIWSGRIIGEAGLALLALTLCGFGRRHRAAVAGCVVAFLSGPLIFSNLYFVHEYYFYGSGIFLVAAVGLALCGLLEEPAVPPLGGWIFALVMVLLPLGIHARFYLYQQLHPPAPPPLADVVQRISRPGDVIVVLGEDWEASLPYYAERRALMLRLGRERDPEGIKRSVARLDPATVAAVIIKGGDWNNGDLTREGMPTLNLGIDPLFADGKSIGIWVPRERRERLRETLQKSPAEFLHIVQPRDIPGQPRTLYGTEIRQRPEFGVMVPRPSQAVSAIGFGAGTVDGAPAIDIHAAADLTFRIPKGATRLTATFGVHEAAYNGPGWTDGVEFVVTHRPPHGPSRVIFRRPLNPKPVVADRGPQSLDFTSPTPLEGELLLHIDAGPAGNISFDWAYVSAWRLQ